MNIVGVEGKDQVCAKQSGGFPVHPGSQSWQSQSLIVLGGGGLELDGWDNTSLILWAGGITGDSVAQQQHTSHILHRTGYNKEDQIFTRKTFIEMTHFWFLQNYTAHLRSLFC